MQPERWSRIQDLFAACVELPSHEQKPFLERECGADDDLRSEVESLLEFDSVQADTLSLGILEVAQSLLRSESLTGNRIGPYIVVRELGARGMGEVYLAARADDQYQELVAIKVVKPGLNTHSVIESFRHERQILAKLDHPYVARLLDGGTTSTGVPYFVMEYVKGMPIVKYAAAENLNVEQRCQLFLKVCEAVAYAHRNLVDHRDLKPNNILVTAHGTPKLLDFGLAKVLNPQSSGGYPSTAMDVYSLGAIFYELLAGVKPHQPLRPSTYAPNLPADLDNIVLMSMRKETAHRYLSVELLAADIQRHLDGLPVQAREGTIRNRQEDPLKDSHN